MTSCNCATVGTVAPADIDVLDKVRSLDIMPRQTEGVSNPQNNAGQRGRAVVSNRRLLPSARVSETQNTGSFLCTLSAVGRLPHPASFRRRRLLKNDWVEEDL
jgi:hypothetical protein